MGDDIFAELSLNNAVPGPGRGALKNPRTWAQEQKHWSGNHNRGHRNDDLCFDHFFALTSLANSMADWMYFSPYFSASALTML